MTSTYEMSTSDLIAEDIEAYLLHHQHKSLLRFLTCGSVDDGKSTLIGRMLYDSKMIFEDQLAALEVDSRKVGTQGGDIDFAFALETSPLPTGAQSLYLAQDELALVMRRNHPLATHDWTLSDYGEVPHILIRLLNDGVNDLDALLAVQGIKRRTLWSTPHFLAALAAVSATDAVTTLSRAFATRFADQFDLILHRPPIDNPSLGIVLVMAKARDHDPLMAWVADQVKRAAIEVYAVSGRR